MNAPVTLSDAKAPQQLTGDQQIDQTKVDTAVRIIQADVPMSESQLANALRNPNLNDAEKTAIVQQLAKDDSSVIAFYANDATRADRDPGALASDQAVIGQALQSAYESGAISADDLVRISDFNGVGNGAQRLLDTLIAGGGGAANGTVEALSDALWARNGNDGLDRAGAALGYLSSPDLTSRNLNTPDARREAFEALVKLNGNDDNFDAGSSGKIWQQSALSSAGRLFVNNSAELIDYYTGANGGTAQTETLAKFFSQTVLNPNAQGLVLDHSRDLIPAIRSSLDQAAGSFLDGARNAPAGSLAQERFMEQFGRLTASVSGGAALALTRYDDQIMANKESREQFVGMVGDLVGLTKLGDVPGADKATDFLAGKLYDAITENPKRPDQALAGVLYDSYAGQIDSLSTQLNQSGLRTSFDSAYSAELLNLQQNLNVNLGGHEQ